MPPPIIEPFFTSLGDKKSSLPTGWKLNQQSQTLLQPVKPSQRTASGSATILSESVRQWTGQNLQLNSTSLVQFLSLLSSLSAQQMPPATRALIGFLADRLTTPRMLINALSLQSALRGGSLLLGGGMGTDSAAKQGETLQSLLMQLFAGLEAANKAARGSMAESYGLSQYQSTGRYGQEVVLLMLRDLGKDLARMLVTQEPPPESAEGLEYRWIFELPINFQNVIRPVYLRFRNRKLSNSKGDQETVWTVEFEFQLPKLGDLRIELTAEDLSIAIQLVCTSSTVADLLKQNQDTLREKLGSYGLQFSGLQCCPIKMSEFHAHRSIRKRVAALVENIPLSNFEMRSDSRVRNPVNGIPDSLYCAMAGLFDYILQLEEQGD